ncbi:hypothetical protein RLEG12_08725 (plasmid) [Rhizobium leguminosarum bv. trifolii CB782]|nr:hypothetical protein RLEG12_08725 [Rhizobium leguminosarum bv. trifolii CB782]
MWMGPPAQPDFNWLRDDPYSPKTKELDDRIDKLAPGLLQTDKIIPQPSEQSAQIVGKALQLIDAHARGAFPEIFGQNSQSYQVYRLMSEEFMTFIRLWGDSGTKCSRLQLEKGRCRHAAAPSLRELELLPRVITYAGSTPFPLPRHFDLHLDARRRASADPLCYSRCTGNTSLVGAAFGICSVGFESK